MREGDVRDEAVAEERADPPLGAIEELIGHDDVERLVLLFRLPTALADRMRSTPSTFMPKMLARKFSSDGSSRWPAPWRARNATRLPRSVPMTYGPDGSPNGVATCRSSRSVSSAMSYRPLPPMMPMLIDSSVLNCLQSAQAQPGATRFDVPPAVASRM